MYSLDSRNGGSLKAATHSALAGERGERVFFSVSDNPKDAKLRIKSVEEADGGIYRCRVDYFNSPTRNFRVNLTLVGSYSCFVILPFTWNSNFYFNQFHPLITESPDEPRIFDAQGKEVTSVAGPFREGHELFLSCSVTGGNFSFRHGKFIYIFLLWKPFETLNFVSTFLCSPFPWGKQLIYLIELQFRKWKLSF